MLTFAERQARLRRSLILQALAEDRDYSMSDAGLGIVLKHLGQGSGRDEVRAYIQYCERHQLVTVERLPVAGGELWVATLTAAGKDVAEGTPHEGIDRPQPRG